MSWVLIAILTSQSPTIVIMRYPNKVSCEASRLWIKSNSSVTSDNSVCLPDVDEALQAEPVPESEKGQ